MKLNYTQAQHPLSTLQGNVRVPASGQQMALLSLLFQAPVGKTAEMPAKPTGEG